jgi:hypothetical protein
MRPKYIAGPIRDLSNAKFIPHIGNNVFFGMVITISTNLSTRETMKSNQQQVVKKYNMMKNTNATSCQGIL